jgi:hypothetical protein
MPGTSTSCGSLLTDRWEATDLRTQAPGQAAARLVHKSAPCRPWIRRSARCVRHERPIVSQVRAVKAVLNLVTVSPHSGRAGGPNWTQEMKLRAVQERTEFDWRF